MDGPHFELNGTPVALGDCDARQSLLRWLREQRITATKEGCADGDCGACTVALVEPDGDGTARYRAVNSCLLPMGLLAGRRVLTAEALADGERLHPAQQALVDCAGSQCGYCTPGIVMSLFVGLQNGELDDATTEGNLCRCTGYRPIRAAMIQLRGGAPVRPACAPSCMSSDTDRMVGLPLPGFLQPTALDEALALKRAHPGAAWIAGATDLGVELSRGRAAAPAFIAIDRLAELQAIEQDAAAATIGAGVTLRRIETELHGQFASLDAMLHGFAARQVKNRATLGGNLGTASPIGDLLPVLLALDAELECASVDGRRWLPLADYFTGYRTTRRQPDELITRVRIPRQPQREMAYKVAKRATDDISIVAAAFALQLDASGRVRHLRIACGGVAAVPLRITAVEQQLLGQRLDPPQVEQAALALQRSVSPLSDHRASADYRRALVGNLFRRFVDEHGR